MVVKEALNNVVKHSGASACEIKVVTNDNSINIEVNDNGKGFNLPSQEIGFPKEEPGRVKTGAGALSGNGLKNMQKRIEELNGTFRIISDKVQGTRIEVSVPFV